MKERGDRKGDADKGRNKGIYGLNVEKDMT